METEGDEGRGQFPVRQPGTGMKKFTCRTLTCIESNVADVWSHRCSYNLPSVVVFDPEEPLNLIRRHQISSL